MVDATEEVVCPQRGPNKKSPPKDTCTVYCPSFLPRLKVTKLQSTWLSYKYVVLLRIWFSAMSADGSGSEDEGGRRALQSIQVRFKLLQNQHKQLFWLLMTNRVLEG